MREVSEDKGLNSHDGAYFAWPGTQLAHLLLVPRKFSIELLDLDFNAGHSGIGLVNG